MGSYATTTSISNLIPNYLSGNTTTSDTAGTTQFSAHIDRAEGIVNAYLSRWYSLPFSAVPPAIRTVTEDIACYYALRSAYTQDGMSKNPFYEAYKVAMDLLKDIGDMTVSLVDTSGAAIPSMSNSRFLSNTEGQAPIFAKDDPTEWRRSQAEIDATEAERDN